MTATGTPAPRAPGSLGEGFVQSAVSAAPSAAPAPPAASEEGAAAGAAAAVAAAAAIPGAPATESPATAPADAFCAEPPPPPPSCSAILRRLSPVSPASTEEMARLAAPPCPPSWTFFPTPFFDRSSGNPGQECCGWRLSRGGAICAKEKRRQAARSSFSPGSPVAGPPLRGWQSANHDGGLLRSALTPTRMVD